MMGAWKEEGDKMEGAGAGAGAGRVNEFVTRIATRKDIFTGNVMKKNCFRRAFGREGVPPTRSLGLFLVKPFAENRSERRVL